MCHFHVGVRVGSHVCPLPIPILESDLALHHSQPLALSTSCHRASLVLLSICMYVPQSEPHSPLHASQSGPHASLIYAPHVTANGVCPMGSLGSHTSSAGPSSDYNPVLALSSWTSPSSNFRTDPGNIWPQWW